MQMNRKLFVAALLVSAPALALSALAAGCGDDEVFRNTDTRGFDSGPSTETGPSPDPDGGDGAPPSGCGNAAGSPERLLLSMNVFSPASSELVAFNIADKKVDGRFSWAGSIGASSSVGTDPYVVE